MTALPTSTKHDVIRLLHTNEVTIRTFGVRRLGLFGSFRQDEARADSDVDLLVEFQPGETTFDHFMGLSFFCEELFGRRVEIVTPNSLSPYLGWGLVFSRKWNMSLPETDYLRQGKQQSTSPKPFRDRYPAAIPWRAMAGLRDRVVHDYLGVDYELVWDVVKTPKQNP